MTSAQSSPGTQENGPFAGKPSVPVPGVWPLGQAQRGLWFLDNFHPGSSFYVISTGLRLRGALDVSALRAALNDCVVRQNALRTRFVTLDGFPYQVFVPPYQLELPLVDGSGLDPAAAEDFVRERLDSAATTPFDLASEPLLRAELLRLSDDHHVLVFAVHHIVFDGWSAQVLLNELAEDYAAHASGARPAAAPLEFTVGEHAVRQEARFAPGTTERAAEIAHWRRVLDGACRLELPTDRVRPERRTFAGNTLALDLEPATTQGVRALAGDCGVTPFTVLATAFALVLAQLSGQRDVLLGVPLAGRTDEESTRLIGFLVNVLPLRADLTGVRSFADALDRFRQPVLDLLTHQELPFGALVDELQPERTGNRNPFFDVCFQYLPSPDAGLRFGDLEVELTGGRRPSAQFDLSCDVHDHGDVLTVALEYSTEVFTRRTALLVHELLATTLRSAVADPTAPLARAAHPVTALTSSEPMHAQWRPGGLRSLVAARAAEQPEAPALVMGAQTLTYRELDRRASNLAAHLVQKGVRAGDLVGVLLERSVDLPVAVLAVLQCGAAYVPVDPLTPTERAKETLARAGCALLLVHPQTRTLGETLGPTLVEVGPDADAVGERLPAPSAVRTVRRDDAAYLIFTSGSSGRPKGVLVSQEAALTLAAGAAVVYELTPGDRVLQMASAAVDVSVEEFFGAWQAGACVVMHAPAQEDLEDLIRRREVSVLNLPASRWHDWTADLAARDATVPGCVRLVVAGSERVDPARVRTWRSGPGRGVRLLNAYGTTEASVSSVWYDTEHLDGEADFTRNVPIGGPLPHVRLYVLDAEARPVPSGIPGELYIAGPGVGIGYLADGATTADRFLPDPFGGEPGARMYRTGDRVRRLPSGALDYLGRSDTQVKVRGFRIDLAEVERTATEVTGVADFVADVRPDQHGAARLIGYVKAAEDAGRVLEEARVEQWRTVHDLDTYHEAGTGPVDFNTSGWISSYTQEPIPRAEMREWLDATVERILEKPAERVLEIGCGTGMILFRVAPSTAGYVGTDIAAGALAYVTGQLASAGLDHGRVRLIEAAADDLSAVGDESFDLIVVNSVAQYFPDLAYLERVLKGAWRRLRPGGRIFLGDIRDVSTLEAFHLSVCEARGLFAGDLGTEAAERVEADSELCVHPGWFTRFAQELPGATAITEVKRGRADTEMNRFRYDVSLWRDSPAPARARPARHEGPVTAQEFTGLLDRIGDGGLVLSAVPDARSHRDVVRAALLRGDEDGLRTPVPAADLPHPDDLREMAHVLGCRTSIRPQGNGLLTVLVRAAAGDGTVPPWPADEPVPVPVAANQPLRAARDRAVIAAVREHLTSCLPPAMVPTRFLTVEEIPLSVSGKVDRGRLPEPGRHSDSSGRMRPRTDAERDLCAIWSHALGLDEVGIRDNFFQVGGDSITWLQVMSRAIRSGYRLGARDVFDHQTVEELAALLAERDRSTPDGNPSPSEAERPVSAGLTPIQHWFFEAFREGRHHQNQYQWYELTAGHSRDHFEQALRTVVEHHDGLLSHFTLGPEGLRQHRATEGAPARLPVREIDVTGVAADRRTGVLRRESDLAQGSLHITDGPLFAAVLFRTADDEPDLVFWCVHHLVVDAVSWQFLSEDLDTALTALAAQETPLLPPRSGDALDWARWSQEEADRLSDEELGYWRSTVAAPAFALPVRYPERSPLAADAHLTARTVGVPGAADRSGEAMLAGCLAALRPALAEQAGIDNGTVWLEFHGRPLTSDAPDMSRSAGWFTALFPFLLIAGHDSEGIRSRLSSLPHGGVGYGRARHLRGEHLMTGANVVVNYLGPAATPTEGRLMPAPGYADISGPVAASDAVIPFAAEINIALDRDGSLTVRAHLGARHFDETAAHAFADRIAAQLEAEFAVASAVAAPDDGFALLPDSVQAQEYGIRLRQRPDIVAAYALSPMQRSMLYRHLIDPAADVNYNDFTLTLCGALDPDLFRAAWRALAARHEVLRTSFQWEHTGEPVQLVHREAAELRVLDWSGTEPADVAERLERLHRRERAAPLPLDGAPPFRLTLVMLGHDSHQLLWYDHHILLDGWSSGILVRELTEAYAELAAGREPFGSAAAPVRFRDYLGWLRQRSGAEASAYWRTELADFAGPTRLPFDAPPPASVAGAGNFHEVATELDAELLAGLRGRAEQDRTTLGALLQAAWAAFLHRQTGSERVVFGVAQSGRPAELGDADGMVGMYMMTLPLVARVSAEQSLSGLLRQVSQQGWRLMSLAGHGSLWDVYDWARIPVSRALFHSALVVQSFGAPPAGGADLPVRAELAPTRTATGFPLTVVVDPASGRLRMIADERCFADATVRQLLTGFQQLLVHTVAGPVDRIGDLPSASVMPGTVTAPPRRSEDDPPRGATETRVAAVWRAVLGIEQVNRDVNLFDSGATSLSAVRLHHRLCAEFGVELPITDVFRCPTVASTAAMLDAMDTGGESIRTAEWVARNDRRRQALLQASLHRARTGRRPHSHRKGMDG